VPEEAGSWHEELHHEEDAERVSPAGEFVGAEAKEGGVLLDGSGNVSDVGKAYLKYGFALYVLIASHPSKRKHQMLL